MQNRKKLHAMIDASMNATEDQMQIADQSKRDKTLLFSYKSFDLCKITLPQHTLQIFQLFGLEDLLN